MARTRGATAAPKKKKSLFARLVGLLPVWVTHILSSRFLDTDLAFLHFQARASSARAARSSFRVVQLLPQPYIYSAPSPPV